MWLSTRQVAELLRVSMGLVTTWRLRQSPGISYPEPRKYGGRWYYNKQEVVRWMRAN